MAQTRPWIDLSFYGLKLHLVPAGGGRASVVAIGATAPNSDALQSLGFAPHAGGYWHRSFAAGEGLDLGALRAPGAFPEARSVQLPVAQILLNISPAALAGAESEEPRLRVADVDRQPAGAARTAARLLSDAGIRTRVEDLARESGGRWRGALQVDGVADTLIEIEMASDGAARVALASTEGGPDGRLVVVERVRFEVDPAGRLQLADHGQLTEGRWRARQDFEGAGRFLASLEAAGVGQRGRWRGEALAERPPVPAPAAPVSAGDVLAGETEEGAAVRVTVEGVERDGEGWLVALRASVAGDVYVLDAVSVAGGRAAALDAIAAAVEDDAASGAIMWSGGDAPADVDQGVPAGAEESEDEHRAGDGPAGDDRGTAGGGRNERRSGSGEPDGADLRGADAGGGDDAGSGVRDADAAAGAGEPGAGEGEGTRRRRRTSAAHDADRVLDSAKEGRANYRLIEADDLIRSSFNEARACERNIAALRALARVEVESGDPDPEDLAAMVRYVGWGGLPSVFVPGSPMGATFGSALQDLVGEEAFATARASTLNAHYTAIPVIDAAWSAVVKAGFSGGRVLEPGAGIGLFIARTPEGVAESTRWVAVEKEPTTARLLKALHPRARVFAQGFETAPIPDASVDLVIGNVPFGDFQVYDPRYRKLKAPIHDYFILKSLDKLKPGGVMAVITSTGTLDKARSKYRAAMHESADLIAAVRLPNDTFAGNAGTQVTTDWLFFRKRLPGEAAQPFDWEGSIGVRGSDGSECRINAIFGTRRGKLLGNLVTRKAMYGGPRVELVAKGTDARPVSEWTEVFADVIPEGTFAVAPAAEDAAGADEGRAPDPFGERVFAEEAEGALVEQDGHLGEVVYGQFQRLAMSRADEARVRALIPLRDRTKECLRLQLEDGNPGVIRGLQGLMRDAYDAFVSAHGPINRPVNRRAFSSDPDVELLCALEVYDRETQTAKPASIFSERTLGPAKPITRCESAEDALAVTINDFGRVVPERICRLLDCEWEEAERQLQGKIFRDPSTGEFVIAPLYLSGNIRRKLDTARAAAEADPAFAANVEALEARLPRQLTADEIDAALGAPWIPSDVIEAFARHVYASDNVSVSVRHNPYTADWRIEIPKWATAPQWETTRIRADALLEASLRGQAPRIWDQVDDGAGGTRPVLNAFQTALALEKQRTLEEEFGRWIWDEPERRNRLVTLYNETFNAYRSANFGDVRMSVPGMALGRSLRPIQASAVARVVMQQSVLLAHPVGFGKTATMAAAAMKLRSLGASQKICQVVPKNVIDQFGGEIKRWFPGARVLAIRSGDLNPKGRQAFWRRVQVTNPDVVLVTPEAFKRIKLPREAEIAFINEEIGTLEMALAHEQAAGGDGKAADRGATRSVKRIEKMKESLKNRLERLLNAEEKDDGRVSFRDLGLTDLFVDEAHRYKNLQVVTRERVLGVPTAASQRALDLAMKVRYVQHSGGRVVMATGSPITNTLAEAFNLQRYLMQEELEALGIANFDAWKAQFCRLVHSLEPDPGGNGYRTVARLAELRNVPEVVALLGQVTDAVKDDAALVGGRPTPRFITKTVEPNEGQRLFRKVLSERVQEMRKDWRAAMERGDNILVVLGDSRRASLDLRTLYPKVPADLGGGKLPEVAATIADVYRRHDASRGTQAVFLDFGTPATTGRKTGFNAYEDLTQRLVAHGIPRGEIAWIHDAKSDEAKGELFRRVRAGEIRVMIGSTEKMGEGSNMQDRMVALHHLNAPAHPGHVIQRNGRAIRQGNQNTEVEIYTYVTRGLLEDWGWHLVLLKDAFVRQVVEGLAANLDGADLARRIVEDGAASMDFGVIEAEASDNPLVKQKAKVDATVNRLEMLRMAHGQQRGRLRADVSAAEQMVERNSAWASALRLAEARMDSWVQTERQPQLDKAREAALAALEAQPEGPEPVRAAPRRQRDSKAERKAAIQEETFVMTVGGELKLGRVAASEALHRLVQDAVATPWRSRVEVGEYRGLGVELQLRGGLNPWFQLRVRDASRQWVEVGSKIDVSESTLGTLRRIENAAAGMASDAAHYENEVARRERFIAQARPLLEAVFPEQTELDTAKARQREINLALAEANVKPEGEIEIPASEEMAEWLRAAGVYGGPLRDADEFDLAVERGPVDEDEDESEDDAAAAASPSQASAPTRRSAEAAPDADEDDAQEHPAPRMATG